MIIAEVLVVTWTLIFFGHAGYRTSAPPTSIVYYQEKECWDTLIQYKLSELDTQHTHSMNLYQKSINDAWGHGSKDKLTKERAEIVNKYVEKQDDVKKRIGLPGICTKRSLPKKHMEPLS